VVIVWRVRGKTIRSVLCNIVCNNCAQYDAHTYEQTNSSLDWVLSHWAHFTRDGHETSVAETETLAFRDRDETETFGLTSRDETETRRSDFVTRPRRDVCRSRDVTETLKCTFIVTNAVYYLNS